ncbi:LysR family transcriptional regulator [Burkholderia lata]|uniref:LysR family transcriptional regulator n=1 Tax=Burkholderia lata (strain ATCC 17760 / DSM 23089 / LMG 22485 / NCIMB 9086 / R18194 / 383) TaxID=482957 RepID=A0A6P3A0D5_BURL3|nr:LysR family transcriptional regulator [Burkholderia lata]VWD40771.1 LysR family transcriptional regulator [Burkholderia lata]
MDKMTALTMFVATAEHGGFTRAAEQLGKTPSAITKGITQLEAELGARLFERTTRRMALTEAGHIYLEAARQALMQLQLAGEEVEQLQHELRGTLRIATSPAFGPAFFTQVCCRFMREHPLVRVEVEMTEADPLDGSYDLAMRDGPTDLPGVIAQPLLENRLLLCASPAYIARKGDDVTLDNYQAHDWLIFRHPLINRHFWWVGHGDERKRVKQPIPRLSSGNYDFLLACLLDGHGLQFAPAWSVARYLAQGDLVEVRTDLSRETSAFGPWIHVLFLPHRRHTRKVRVFIQFLREQLLALGLTLATQGTPLPPPEPDAARHATRA